MRAHIFLCVLAYYVQWHMLEAWRELLFCDEDQDAKTIACILALVVSMQSLDLPDNKYLMRLDKDAAPAEYSGGVVEPD